MDQPKKITGQAQNGRIFKYSIVSVASVVCFGTSSFVSAQTLDEFCRAAAADGVDVIPFEALRRDTTSIADEVERRKNPAFGFKFETLAAQKDNLLAAAAKTKQDIENKAEEIDQFKKDHPDGSSKPLEEELEKLKKSLDDQQAKVTKFNEDELEDALDAWERLWNARAGLREYFEDVVDKLEDVEYHPTNYIGSNASEEDIARLKNCVSVIENEIEVQANNHKEQENGAKSNKEKFDALIRKNEL